jgi:hypothetical protein
VSVLAPAPAPAPDDELVLGWWEQYDAGCEPDVIAARAGVPTGTVKRALQDLDVLDDPIVRRAKLGKSLPDELAIMDALARIGGPEDLSPERREVPWAHSMQHTTPKRGPVVQSERQRRQDRMATSKWRAAVRYDLRMAGLIP